MKLRTKPCFLSLVLVGASLAISGCQNTNGVPAANTSTAGSTTTHDTVNPPPPATASSERSGPR